MGCSLTVCLTSSQQQTDIREQTMQPLTRLIKIGSWTMTRQDVHPTEDLALDKFICQLRGSDFEACTPLTMACCELRVNNMTVDDTFFQT